MKKALLFMFVLALAVTFVSAGKPACNDNQGAIWTTTGSCGADPQDENHYQIGDVVYINGNNFCAKNYNWDITGQPGQASCDPNVVVASGNYTVGANGEFCFAAYTIKNDDCGEYKATFSGKHDNYRVDEPKVPEFGVIAGIVALIGAVGIVAFKRK